MQHEDDSVRTKLGVGLALILLLLVFGGCAVVMWQVLKIIIGIFYFD